MLTSQAANIVAHTGVRGRLRESVFCSPVITMRGTSGDAVIGDSTLFRARDATVHNVGSPHWAVRDTVEDAVIVAFLWQEGHSERPAP